MPIATNLIVTTKNGNKTKTTNITYANPEAADSSLATFAASVFSLSQNELVSIERVNKTSLTFAKSAPNLNVGIYGIQFIKSNESHDVTVSYSGDGVLSVTLPEEVTDYVESSISGKTITLTCTALPPSTISDVDVTVSVSETATYSADSGTLKLTVVAEGSTEPGTPR